MKIWLRKIITPSKNLTKCYHAYFFTKYLATYVKIFSGTCSSNGMQHITTIQECNSAAQAIGNPDITATETEDAARPEGCYDNGNLWLAINPVNKGNGADSTRHPICKLTGKFHS